MNDILKGEFSPHPSDQRILKITKFHVKYLPTNKELTNEQFENIMDFENKFQKLIQSLLKPPSEDKYISTLTKIYNEIPDDSKYLTAFAYYYKGCQCGKDECNTPSGTIYVMLTKDYKIEINEEDCINRYKKNIVRGIGNSEYNIHQLIINYEEKYNEENDSIIDTYEIYQDYQICKVKINIKLGNK